MHATERGTLQVVGRFDRRKVRLYRERLVSLFGSDFFRNQCRSWLDIGTGYGELLTAIGEIDGADETRLAGIEPCEPKRDAATARGLDVRSTPLDDLSEQFDVVSMINVFSHLPDPRSFLRSITRLVAPGGSLVIVTGNGADLPASELPRPLDLPDHLVFGGERHLVGFLNEEGYQVSKIDRYDEFMPESRIALSAKNFIKAALGRTQRSRTRGTNFRSLFIRAIRA